MRRPSNPGTVSIFVLSIDESLKTKNNDKAESLFDLRYSTGNESGKIFDSLPLHEE
jgi:hypothetical protein